MIQICLLRAASQHGTHRHQIKNHLLNLNAAPGQDSYSRPGCGKSGQPRCSNSNLSTAAPQVPVPVPLVASSVAQVLRTGFQATPVPVAGLATAPARVASTKSAGTISLSEYRRLRAIAPGTLHLARFARRAVGLYVPRHFDSSDSLFHAGPQ